MAKILIGLLAAIVIAVVGFFGFQLYVQHRAAAEVETAFEQIRSSGAKASHGEVTFDVWKRTLTVADIEAESAAQPPVSVKIGSFTASGLGQPDATHFSADQIDATDVAVGGTKADPAGWRINYKAPRITVKDYSGPAGVQQPPASSSGIDLYRFALAQFAGISASSVSMPSLNGSFGLSAAASVTSDSIYSDVVLEGIKDGKIATTKLASVAVASNAQQAGNASKFAGTIENLVSSDIDTTALAAVLDPQNASDDRYHRVYRQISSGAYTLAFTLPPGQATQMRIDGIKIDDVGLRPSRLQISAILGLMPATGTPPTPAQAREMIEKLAGLYEGIRVGSLQIRGASIDTPQGPAKLSAIRFNLENGKSDFAIEGVDAASPKGPVRVEHFALKSLDLANLLRISALFANPAQRPAPDQALRLLTMLGGAEVRGVVAPFKDTGKQVNIDNISLNWGQFVGPIPTQAHLAARMAGPVDATDPTQKALVALGLNTLALDVDFGVAWTEASGALVLDPVTVNIGGLANVSAHAALANVPRTAFSLNPQQAAAMAAQIQAGTLDVTLRDAGGVGLLVAQYARTHGVSADDAKRAIVEAIKASGASTTTTNPGAANPDATAITQALARFVDDPRGTLTIKLTPRAKAPALQLIQLVKTQPLDALAQFHVEVSTGP
jgi:hypothetical protein